MNRILFGLGLLLLFAQCIPYKSADTIFDYQVEVGRKFQKGLPERNMFLFEDPKEANAFYHFIDNRFELHGDNVADDVPFVIDGQQYFFAFYETSQSSKGVSFVNLLTDAVVSSALNTERDPDAVPEEMRSDKYYIGIEVYSDLEEDCLAVNALAREPVLKYLRNLKEEYLATKTTHGALSKN